MFDVYARVYLGQLLALYAFYAAAFVLFTAWEALEKREPLTIGERIRGLRFWALFLPIDLGAAYAFSFTRNQLGIEPLLVFESNFGLPVISACVALIWGNFTFYWFHRFQHRYLWRWHSVHHSVENLSAVNSYHHWTEPLWKTLIISLPLAFVSLEAVQQAGWLRVFFGLQIFYIHSQVRFHHGPLGKVLVDNRFHRIHHSVEPRHFDKNFGTGTTLWDWLFGTAYFPAKGEWPAVGVAGQPEPKTVRQWASVTPSPSTLVDDLPPASAAGSA